MLPLSRSAIKTVAKDNRLYVSFRIQTITTPLPNDSELMAIIKPTWIKERYATKLVRDGKRVNSNETIIPAPKSGIPPNATVDIFSNGVIVSTLDLCLTNDEEIWRFNAPETLTSSIVKGIGVTHIVFSDVVWKCPENFQPTNNTHIAITYPGAKDMTLSDVMLVNGALIPLKVLSLECTNRKRSKYVISVHEGDIILVSVPIRVTIPKSNAKVVSKPVFAPIVPIPTSTSTSIVPSIPKTFKKRKITPEFVFDIPNELEYVMGANKIAYLCLFKLRCPENYVPVHAELVIHCSWNEETIRRALVLRDGWLMFMPIKLDIRDEASSLSVHVHIEQSGEKAFEHTSFLRNIAITNTNVSPVLSAALEELIFVHTNAHTTNAT